MNTPSFSLDFTAATLDPIITFTRAGATATRVNSSGYVESVAADTARFDYDPVTKVCRGLLIEETRVNSYLRSADFNQAVWVKTNSAAVTNAATSPENLTTASSFTENTATGAHWFAQETTLVSGTRYVFSFFVKANGRKFFQITSSTSLTGNGFSYQNYDLENGALGSGAGAGITASITNFGNGWYRCTYSDTANASALGRVICATLTSLTAGRLQSYTGDNTSGIYVWGAQVEAGAFLTSYIPTTTGTVTRNADVATITATNFSDWWQAGKGGVTARAQLSTVVGTRPWLQFDDNTADNLIALRGNTTNPELYIKATTDQAQIDAGTIAANTTYSLTGWWQPNDCKARLDSGAAVVDTSATIPTVTQARLGSDGTNYLNGHLASIAYYDVFSSRIYTRRKNKVVSSLL